MPDPIRRYEFPVPIVAVCVVIITVFVVLAYFNGWG